MSKTRMYKSSSELYADDSDAGSDVIDRLAAYEQRVNRDSRHEQELVSALALRCYHLPGYTYCGDWFQYFRNNHPIFGLFFYNRLHPIGFKARLLLLIGSIMFGLAVTNIIWLWFYYSGSNQNNAAVTIDVQGVGNAKANDTFKITQGMVMLWTVGGLLHALFDNTVWHISACVCCLSSQRWEKYKSYGTYIIIVTVLTFTAIGTLAVLLRTSADQSQGSGHVALKLNKASLYSFLITYGTELALSLFVYYPLIGTILFTGVLGCGSVPVLGGRPYEVKMEERRIQEMARRGSGTDSGSDRV
jgi:hypothetical protein